jgi:hypothetical protein
VRYSKSGRSVFVEGLELLSCGGRGIRGNYIDIKTRDEYWVSGPRKNGEDRHWAGSGTVKIDPDVAEEYWRDIRQSEPPENPLVA